MGPDEGLPDSDPAHQAGLDGLRRSASELERSDQVHQTDPLQGVASARLEALVAGYGQLNLAAGPSAGTEPLPEG